jgi:hypothetical protein
MHLFDNLLNIVGGLPLGSLMMLLMDACHVSQQF